MLRSRLPQIAVEIELRIDQAIQEGAETVERSAKTRVPVATGKLRDHIHVEREPEGAYVVAGDDEDVWYGHLVEYGTSHSAPRPFLVPALEENRDGVVARTRASLKGL